jgi:hypothetical protein
VTLKESRAISKLMNANPRCAVRLTNGLRIGNVCSHRGHQVVWIEYAGRVTELDLGPRGVKIVR